MEGNQTEEQFTGSLRQCNYYYVTYYSSSSATGMYLCTNVALITINTVFFLFGSLANLLIVLASARNNRLRTLSNIPLVSLACSDLLVTAIVLPLSIARMVKEILGSHNCILSSLTKLATYFCCGVSLLTVTFISLDRFITLAYPYNYYNILTRTRVKIVVVATWLVTLAFALANCLGLVPYKMLLLVAASITVLSVLIMLSAWCWIYHVLRRHRNSIAATQRPSVVIEMTPKTNPQQTYRTTTTSCVIVTSLILCYLPLIVILVYYMTEPSNFVGIFVVTPWAETVVLARSVFSPLYVLWRKSDFKDGARELLCRVCCCVERSTTREITNVMAQQHDDA